MAPKVIGRSVVLIGSFIAGLLTTSQGRCSCALVPERPTPRGFTLLETIIVVSLIGLLIALLTPALAGFRRGAHDAVGLANIRSHAVVIAAYTEDWDQLHPAYMDPEATAAVFRVPGAVIVLRDYFGGFSVWNLALAEQYYGGAWNSASFFNPRRPDEVLTAYWYSAAFIADPEFWMPTRRTGPSQWRPTRTHEVVFPAAKGLLVDGVEMKLLRPKLGETHRTAVGFVDGSGRRVRVGSFLGAYPGGEGNWRGSFFHSGIAVMHTLDGLRGRDVK